LARADETTAVFEYVIGVCQLCIRLPGGIVTWYSARIWMIAGACSGLLADW